MFPWLLRLRVQGDCLHRCNDDGLCRELILTPLDSRSALSRWLSTLSNFLTCLFLGISINGDVIQVCNITLDSLDKIFDYSLECMQTRHPGLFGQPVMGIGHQIILAFLLQRNLLLSTTKVQLTEEHLPLLSHEKRSSTQWSSFNTNFNVTLYNYEHSFNHSSNGHYQNFPLTYI